ncbi:hypothetical protein CDAR_63971 [Caerostris darwini]|uniref:Uncharacterized protein n=1 Tax=Caerostris darwini TaxID=1538125 RepID=A0AAV4PKB7_9ARAC|nr:hypothetical protein CDAR_63971 [Caerostris darwini]
MAAAIRYKSLLEETNGLPRTDKHPLNKKQNFDYETFRNTQRTDPNGATRGHLITLSSLVQQRVKMRLGNGAYCGNPSAPKTVTQFLGSERVQQKK